MAWRRQRRTVQRAAASWFNAHGLDDNGLPTIMRMNRAYADVDNRRTFSFRVVCTIVLAEPRPNGLPTEEQLATLTETERQLDAMFAREGVLVAVVTGSGLRELTYYARVPTEFADDGSSTRQMGAHEVRFRVVDDRDWQEYDRLIAAAPLLRPPAPRFTAETMAVPAEVAAADRVVLDQLVRRGADLSAPRTVRHYLYVLTEADQRDAAAAITVTGWSIEVRPPLSDDPDRRVLVATRTDVVLDDALVAGARALFEAIASRFGGEYDGWEASV